MADTEIVFTEEEMEMATDFSELGYTMYVGEEDGRRVYRLQRSDRTAAYESIDDIDALATRYEELTEAPPPTPAPAPAPTQATATKAATLPELQAAFTKLGLRLKEKNPFGWWNEPNFEIKPIGEDKDSEGNKIETVTVKDLTEAAAYLEALRPKAPPTVTDPETGQKFWIGYDKEGNPVPHAFTPPEEETPKTSRVEQDWQGTGKAAVVDANGLFQSWVPAQPTAYGQPEFTTDPETGQRYQRSGPTDQWTPVAAGREPSQPSLDEQIDALVASGDIEGAQRKFDFQNQMTEYQRQQATISARDQALRIAQSPGEWWTYMTRLRGDQPNVPFELGRRTIPGYAGGLLEEPTAQAIGPASSGQQAALQAPQEPAPPAPTPQAQPIRTPAQAAYEAFKRTPAFTGYEAVTPTAGPPPPKGYQAVMPTLTSETGYTGAVGERPLWEELPGVRAAGVPTPQEMQAWYDRPQQGQATASAVPVDTTSYYITEPDGSFKLNPDYKYKPTPPSAAPANAAVPLPGQEEAAEEYWRTVKAQALRPKEANIGIAGPNDPSLFKGPAFASATPESRLAWNRGLGRAFAGEQPTKPRMLSTLGAPPLLSPQTLGLMTPAEQGIYRSEIGNQGFDLGEWDWQQKKFGAGGFAGTTAGGGFGGGLRGAAPRTLRSRRF